MGGGLAGGGFSGVVAEEPEASWHFAYGLDAGDDFLADVAAFGVGDGVGVETGFGGEGVFIELFAPGGDACVDSLVLVGVWDFAFGGVFFGDELIGAVFESVAAWIGEAAFVGGLGRGLR